MTEQTPVTEPVKSEPKKVEEQPKKVSFWSKVKKLFETAQS